MSTNELQSLCEMSMHCLEHGDIRRARKLMHQAWCLNPTIEIRSMLSKLHKEEIKQIHAQNGHNGKVLFWIRGYFLSYFTPLLLRFPPESIDIQMPLCDEWSMEEIAHLQQRGYRFNEILPQDQWWKYRALFMDHCSDYIGTTKYIQYPPIVVYLVHSTAYIAGETGQPYLTHILYPFEGVAREQQPNFPWVQCGWSGPMQMNDADLHTMRDNIGQLRKELCAVLGIPHVKGPIVACYSSHTDNPLELAQGLKQLADAVHHMEGILVLKAFPSDEPRLQSMDMGRTILWPGKGAGGNTLRLAADIILTGFATSALLSMLLLEKKILPYHTEVEQRGLQRGEKLELVPRFTCSPRRNLRGWKAIQLLGGTSSITRIDVLLPRVKELLHDATYDARCKRMKRTLFGESETKTPVECTCTMLQHLLEFGTFPKQRCCG